MGAARAAGDIDGGPSASAANQLRGFVPVFVGVTFLGLGSSLLASLIGLRMSAQQFPELLIGLVTPPRPSRERSRPHSRREAAASSIWSIARRPARRVAVLILINAASCRRRESREGLLFAAPCPGVPESADSASPVEPSRNVP